ncbi:hypothetical protein [Saccharothrix deserti]|uniref:hypothetical protein n=1 Tax=Saccharothrix deserti TaxID=2593674 RepID=UPI001EE4E96B|nr:hypothetical protein [Saccharothrix deserti]
MLGCTVEAGERLVQLSTFDRAVLTDEQLLEEALVDLPPGLVRCLQIAALDAFGHPKRSLKRFQYPHLATAGRSQFAVCLG